MAVRTSPGPGLLLPPAEGPPKLLQDVVPRWHWCFLGRHPLTEAPRGPRLRGVMTYSKSHNQ